METIKSSKVNMKKLVLYSGSGRSFISNKPIHKMSGVISGLEKKGFNVKFVGGNDLYFRKKTTSAMGGNDIAVYPDENDFLRNSLSEVLDMIHDFLWFFYICFNIIKFKPCLILERSSRLHVSSFIAAKIFSVPVAFEWKNDLVPYEKSLFSKFANYVEKIKFRMSDLVVVESQVLAKSLSYEYPNKKFYVAYNAVNISEIFSPKNTRDIDILYAGGFTKYHDMPTLANALNKINIISTEKDRIKVVVIGNGPEKDKFLDILSLSNTAIDIEILDGMPRNKLSEYYKRSKYGVLPGCTDIIAPIKIFEYIAYGMIPILPKLDCNMEIFHDDLAYYFGSGSASELSNVLVDIFSRDEYSERVESLMRFQNTIEHCYSWSETWGLIPEKLGISK